jgi:lipoprotein-releasing system ATP-binding protein
VFQFHHLLPQYTVLENVLLPAMAPGAESGPAVEARARELIDRVGLADRLEHRPAELSGGEAQRVAVARALVQQPRLVLCDEPTGNLDPTTARGVADLLFELHATFQSILIVVTHSLELAARFRRRVELRDGLLVEG